jgi:hypothetical protein
MVAMTTIAILIRSLKVNGSMIVTSEGESFFWGNVEMLDGGVHGVKSQSPFRERTCPKPFL